MKSLKKKLSSQQNFIFDSVKNFTSSPVQHKHSAALNYCSVPEKWLPFSGNSGRSAFHLSAHHLFRSKSNLPMNLSLYIFHSYFLVFTYVSWSLPVHADTKPLSSVLCMLVCFGCHSCFHKKTDLFTMAHRTALSRWVDSATCFKTCTCIHCHQFIYSH